MWKTLLAATVALAVSAGAPQAQEPPAPSGEVADLRIDDSDYALGPADAKVVVVEYASLTCPHCADFHKNVLPGIKKGFIDAGKVRYVYRDFPLDRVALAAASIARCAGRPNFFGFIETFYATQDRWARASDPIAALEKLARLGGMSKEKFDGCLGDAAVGDEILKRRLEASEDFKVTGTPTLFVNGKRYGAMSLDQFETLLGRLLSE